MDYAEEQEQLKTFVNYPGIYAQLLVNNFLDPNETSNYFIKIVTAVEDAVKVNDNKAYWSSFSSNRGKNLKELQIKLERYNSNDINCLDVLNAILCYINAKNTAWMSRTTPREDKRGNRILLNFLINKLFGFDLQKFLEENKTEEEKSKIYKDFFSGFEDYIKNKHDFVEIEEENNLEKEFAYDIQKNDQYNQGQETKSLDNEMISYLYFTKTQLNNAFNEESINYVEPETTYNSLEENFPMRITDDQKDKTLGLDVLSGDARKSEDFYKKSIIIIAQAFNQKDLDFPLFFEGYDNLDDKVFVKSLIESIVPKEMNKNNQFFDNPNCLDLALQKDEIFVENLINSIIPENKEENHGAHNLKSRLMEAWRQEGFRGLFGVFKKKFSQDKFMLDNSYSSFSDSEGYENKFRLGKL